MAAAAGAAPAVDGRRRRLTIGLNPGELAGVGDVPEEAPMAPPELLKELEGSIVDDLGDDKTGVALMTTTDRESARKRPNSEKDRISQGGTMTAEALSAKLVAEGIGMACKKGFKPESPNQDSFSIFISEDGWKIFGVFDGHGPSGHDVSQFVRENLMKLFLRNPDRDSAPEKALTEAFCTTQELLAHLTATRGMDSSVSGTTGTVAFMPADNSYVVTAYVGDSRGVLCQQLDAAKPDVFTNFDLTVDHKPNEAGEKERIERMGGRVVFDGYYNYRVYSKDGRGGLNMSRALGDCIAHTAGVSEVPATSTKELDVKRTELQPGKDRALLLCTDGVWEFLESEAAVKLVMQHGRDNVQKACEELTQLSYDKWMQDSDGEVSDDITALLIYL